MKKEKTIIPNIFDNATHELSQDAFLAWLLQWTDKGLEGQNKELHNCACKMLDLLLDEHIIVNTVEVYRQYEKIDLWFTFNGNYILIIEDKTNTTEHDDQLERYKNIVEKWCKDNLKNYKIKFVYYKTGDYTESEKETIRNYGYKTIFREDIIRVFENYYDSVNSDFFKDYYLYLYNIENVQNEVFEKDFESIKESEDYLWEYQKGFFRYFAPRLENADWGYVNNQTKPFFGMWWNFKNWKYAKFYLQFEVFELKIKICDLKEKNNFSYSEIRDRAYEKVERVALKNNLQITKPARMGCGSTMTLANVDESLWLAKTSTGKIDRDKTLKKLYKIEKIIDEIIRQK